MPWSLLVGLLVVPPTAVVNASMVLADEGKLTAQRDVDVYMGTPVEACGFPGVVAVKSESLLCSGTLIHPEIVVYAAHCGGGAKLVHFADSLQGGFVEPVSECLIHPGFLSIDEGEDFAYCRLAHPVNVPVLPPAAGCVMDQIDVGTPVTIVGFGHDAVNEFGSSTGKGIKRHAASEIGWLNRQRSEVGIDGYCHGDSGGPALWWDGDTWWTISVVSTGRGCAAAGTGVTAGLVEHAIPWIELETGVDLTPCQADDGGWGPTGACTGFYSGDGTTPEGTWWESCHAAPRSDEVSTCGPPFDSTNDRVAPSVRIESPGGVTTVDAAPLVVHVVVDATDDASGVAWVGLEINGELLAARDTLAPYEFVDVLFPRGAWVVRAIAEDYAGNRQVSAPIAIGVEVPAPDMMRLDDGCAISPHPDDARASLAVWLLLLAGGGACGVRLRRRRPPSRDCGSARAPM